MALATLVGCSKPTEGVDGTLVVYSLEPLTREGKDGAEPDDVFFHTYLILGEASVTEPHPQREIVAAVQKGIEEAEQDPAVHKMCMFMPRHGVRHTAKGGRVTEWVICFSCGEVNVYENGQPLENWETEDRFNGRQKTSRANITRRAQKLLNDTLRNAGVELASGADKGE